MYSTAAEHALPALSIMVSLDDGEPILGKDLARRAKTPANHLSVVLWVLAKRLDPPGDAGQRRRLSPGAQAAAIHLSEVVELFNRQKPERGRFCGAGWDCVEAGQCAADEEWRMLRESCTDFLRNTTLAAIAQREHGCTRSRRRPSSQ